MPALGTCWSRAREQHCEQQPTLSCFALEARARRRYEVERAMINGALDVDDVPRVWNEKMQQYLGCTPQDDKQARRRPGRLLQACKQLFQITGLGQLVKHLRM
jgi:Carboxypeptidase Taq (M32) metallopeptidase